MIKRTHTWQEPPSGREQERPQHQAIVWAETLGHSHVPRAFFPQSTISLETLCSIHELWGHVQTTAEAHFAKNFLGPRKVSNLFPLRKIGCVWESEAGGFGVPGQPEIHKETLLQQ